MYYYDIGHHISAFYVMHSKGAVQQNPNTCSKYVSDFTQESEGEWNGKVCMISHIIYMYHSLLQSCHFYASDLALLLLGGYYYATLATL